MSRIRIQLPEQFSFSTIIQVRITDLNYGGHVGNDTILTLVHEARMQFLKNSGYTEMNMEGVGMIMIDAGIEFRLELFYGDEVKIFVAATEFSRAGFNLYYKLMKDETIVAIAKTGMVCYDYEKKKVVSIPTRAIEKLAAN
ncbi:MAG: acyl-CoA thioesterase [Flavisolibacter sp.]